MVTIATIVTSFLLKKLHSSNSDFNNSVLFAVSTRKNYSKNSPKISSIPQIKKLYGATLTELREAIKTNKWDSYGETIQSSKE